MVNKKDNPLKWCTVVGVKPCAGLFGIPLTVALVYDVVV